MKNGLVKTVLLTCILFIVFSGNAIAKTNITDQITIDRIPFSNSTYIASAKVFQDGEKVIVQGTVKLNRRPHGNFDGHIDVEIISPEGKLIDSISVNYTPPIRSSKSLRKAYRKTRFKACFIKKLQEGSTVRVALHNSGHKKPSKGFNCTNTLARSE